MEEKRMTNKSEHYERDIGLICIGFVPGFLLAINKSMEWVILEPFFGRSQGFEILVVIATIAGLLIGISYLIKNLNLIWGIGSFLSSFIAGYLMGYSMIDGYNIILIVIGLILLFISFGFTIPAFE